MQEITVTICVLIGKYCEANGGGCNHASGDMGDYCSVFLYNLKRNKGDGRLHKCPSCLRACAEGKKEKGK